MDELILPVNIVETAGALRTNALNMIPVVYRGQHYPLYLAPVEQELQSRLNAGGQLNDQEAKRLIPMERICNQTYDLLKREILGAEEYNPAFDNTDNPLLTPTQEQLYVRMYRFSANEQEANWAFEQLLAGNRFYILNEVMKRLYNRQLNTLEIQDLIQIGAIGFYHGVNTFDVTQGNRLLTFAAWHVKKNINFALTNQEPAVPRPESLQENINHLLGAYPGKDLSEITHADLWRLAWSRVDENSAGAQNKAAAIYRRLRTVVRSGNATRVSYLELRAQMENGLDWIETTSDGLPNLEEDLIVEVPQAIVLELLRNGFADAEEYEMLRAYYGIGQQPCSFRDLAQIYGSYPQEIARKIKLLQIKLHRELDAYMHSIEPKLY